MRIATPFCILLVLFSPSAMACQCMQLSVEENIAAAAYVFRARVMSAHVKEYFDEGYGTVNAQFEVLSVLKGDPDELDGVDAALGSGSCEIPIIVGHEYIFFASPDGAISSCGGTILRRRVDYGNASEWLQLLREYGIEPE